MSSTNLLLLLELLNIKREQQKIFQTILDKGSVFNERLYNLIFTQVRSLTTSNAASQTEFPTTFTRTMGAHNILPTLQRNQMTGILSGSGEVRRPRRTRPRPTFGGVNFRTSLNREEAIIPTNSEIRIATTVCKYRDISSNETMCAISRDNFNPDDDVLKIIFCQHFFKKLALEQWFRTHSTCPICRHNIIRPLLRTPIFSPSPQ